MNVDDESKKAKIIRALRNLEAQCADQLVRILAHDGDYVCMLTAQHTLMEGFMWAERAITKPPSPWTLPPHLKEEKNPDDKKGE